MKEILRYNLFDNSIQAYLYVLGTVLLMLFIKRLISKYLAGQLLGIITNRKNAPRKEAFLNLVIKPIENFLITFITITALDRLDFPEAFNFKIFHITTEHIANAIGVTIVVVVFIRLCIRIIEFIAQILEEKASITDDKGENQLIVFFKDFFKVLLLIIGFLLILRLAFNKDISNLLTSLSIVGAAIALATKESLENLIASFIIFFDKPFVMGDLVKVQNFTGIIEKIGLRSTRIRTESKTYISVPNKQMVDSIVDNFTLRTERKVELQLEIDLATSSAQIKKFIGLLKQVMEDKENLSSWLVYLMDTGKTAHTVLVEYYTAMPQNVADFIALREEINLNIIELLEDNQIDLSAKNTDVVVTRK